MSGAFTTRFVVNYSQTILQRYVYGFLPIGSEVIIDKKTYRVASVTVDFDHDSNGFVTVDIRPVVG